MSEGNITREESEELRKLINIANDVLITWKQRAIEAEALAASRLELLREANKDRVITGNRCHVCRKLPIIVAIENTEYKYKDNHADDCELAEELGDD